MPNFQISTNQAGAYASDGVYVQELAQQASGGIAPASNLVFFIGSSDDGTPNIANYAPDAGIANTTLVKSVDREILSSQPECNAPVKLRVTDGTDVATTIAILDAAVATVATLTRKCTGARANGASARLDLDRGTPSAGPVYRLTITYPGKATQVFAGIVGSATPTGAYAPATFQANLLAAVNGAGGSPLFVASAGSSVVAPVTGTVWTGSGGTNGDTSVTETVMIGTDAGPASTGMYALRGQVFGAQIVLAALSSPASFAAVAAFCAQEGCTAWFTFPSGTTTASAVSIKAANSLSDDNVDDIAFWLDMYDSFQGKAVLVSPCGKAAGVLSALAPWQYPGNNPAQGAVGVSSSERLSLGAVGSAERGQLQQNQINWFDSDNGRIVLAHGLTSSGKQINEIRARNTIAYAIGKIGGRFVGGPYQLASTVPFNQADETDARFQLNAALLGYANTIRPFVSAIGIDVGDSVNTLGPNGSMAAGQLKSKINVTTRAGVQFVIESIAVGNNVVQLSISGG